MIIKNKRKKFRIGIVGALAAGGAAVLVGVFGFPGFSKTVSADETQVNERWYTLGASAISPGDKVYFGSYGDKTQEWSVLDTKHDNAIFKSADSNNVSYTGETLLLYTNDILGYSLENPDKNTIITNFTNEIESKGLSSYVLKTTTENEPTLNNEQLFYLSAAEAQQYLAYGKDIYSGIIENDEYHNSIWLRDRDSEGHLYKHFSLLNKKVMETYNPRFPIAYNAKVAANLRADKILYTAFVNANKTEPADMLYEYSNLGRVKANQTLQEVDNNKSTDMQKEKHKGYQLTLLDESNNFKVTTDTGENVITVDDVSENNTSEYSLKYTGAKIGSNSSIVFLFVNSKEEIVARGEIYLSGDNEKEDGVIDLRFPSMLYKELMQQDGTLDSCSLYVCNETVVSYDEDSGYNTNLSLKTASDFVKMPIKINKPKATVQSEARLQYDLVYNGEEQKLLGATPIVENGEAKYTLDNYNWTTVEPTAKAAGSYNVYWKVIGDEEHGNPFNKPRNAGNITIAPKGLTLNWASNQKTFEYNGGKRTVVAMSAGVVQGDSVNLQYEGNEGTDVQKYTARVTGTDNSNYTIDNQMTFSWEITPKSIIGATVTLDSNTLTYNGSPQTKAVDGVQVDGLSPQEGKDYKVSGNSQTNAGKYNITIQAEGNYKDAITKEFEIKPLDISAANVTLGEELTYNGREQQQIVEKVEINGVVLKPDEYIVTGNAGIDAKEYELTITPINNNFTGSVKKKFEIKKKDITNAEIKLGNSLTYNGREQEQDVTEISVDGLTLKDGDYMISGDKQITAGMHRLIITGTGNFIGSVSQDYTINKLPVKIIWTGEVSHVHNGTYKILSPEISNLCGDDKVDLITEGTIAKDKGTYTAKVTGIGAGGLQVLGEHDTNYTIDGGVNLEQTWEILAATPTESESKKTTAKVNRGRPLSEAVITEGEILDVNGKPLKGIFTWKNPTKQMDADGTETLTFTPEDTNYDPIDMQVTVLAALFDMSKDTSDNGSDNLNANADVDMTAALNIGVGKEEVIVNTNPTLMNEESNVENAALVSEKSNVPKTGDVTNIVVWIVIAATVAGIGTTAVACTRKRKRRQEHI